MFCQKAGVQESLKHEETKYPGINVCSYFRERLRLALAANLDHFSKNFFDDGDPFQNIDLQALATFAGSSRCMKPGCRPGSVC